MSSTPIINEKLSPTWGGQLSAILEQHQSFATRANAQSSLIRMAILAEQYAADHPAEDGFHTNAKELVRTALRAHLDGDGRAYTTLLHIAKLADLHDR